MRLVGFGRTLPLRFLVVLAIVGLAVAQVGGSALLVSAQGVATIEITNTDAGTGQPAPFTRFQVTSQNGTVYGPMETDLNGYVAFSVTVDPQGTRFTVEEETPPRVRRRRSPDVEPWRRAMPPHTASAPRTCLVRAQHHRPLCDDLSGRIFRSGR